MKSIGCRLGRIEGLRWGNHGLGGGLPLPNGEIGTRMVRRVFGISANASWHGVIVL